MKKMWVITVLLSAAGGIIFGQSVSLLNCNTGQPSTINPYENERETFRRLILDPTGHAIIIAIGTTHVEQADIPRYAILHKLPPDTAPDVTLPGSNVYAWAIDGSKFALETRTAAETMPQMIAAYNASGDTLAAFGPGYSPNFADGTDTIYFLQDVPSPERHDELGNMQAISLCPRICAYDVHLGTQTIVASFDKALTFFSPEYCTDIRLAPTLTRWRALDIPISNPLPGLSGLLYSRSDSQTSPLYQFDFYHHTSEISIREYSPLDRLR